MAAPAGLNGTIGGYSYITNPTTGAIDYVATPAANTNITALGAATVLPTSASSQTTNYVLNTAVTTTANQAANTLRIVGGNNLTLGGGLVLLVIFGSPAALAAVFGSSCGTVTGSEESEIKH